MAARGRKSHFRFDEWELNEPHYYDEATAAKVRSSLDYYHKRLVGVFTIKKINETTYMGMRIQ